VKKIITSIAALTITLSSAVALAGPEELVTHNDTDLVANVLIDERFLSVPSTPHKTSAIHWYMVRSACYRPSQHDICPATILMDYNTPHPIVLGDIKMNLNTGEIIPAHLSNNGYTMTVNGPGEFTLTKD